MDERTANARVMSAGTPGYRLRVCLLGPFALDRDDRRVAHPDLRRERVRQMLSYLAIHPRTTRQRVAAELWPDFGDEAAGRNLRVTLAYLQRVLEPGRRGSDPPNFLRADGPALELSVGHWLSVDVHEFDRYLDEAGKADGEGATSLALPACQRALALYRGDFCAGQPDTDWAALERDRLRLRHLTAVIRAGELLLADGDEHTPLRLGHEALHAEPWSEAAYRLLISTHLARGEHAQARRTLTRCQAMLADLQVEPEPQIVAGTERPAPSDARRIGPADGSEHLTVSVEVRRRPRARPLPDLAVLGAQRPRERQRIDRAAVAEAYAADPEDLAKVAEFAKEYNLTVETSSAERRTVQLSGSVEQMNQAFGVQLSNFEYTGGTYRSREGHVLVPRALSDVVKRVSGLTNRPLAQPHVEFRPLVVTEFDAVQIGQIYDFPTGVNGAGTCIGIIELGGGYTQQDLDMYFSSVQIPTPNVVAVSVDGAVNSPGGAADGEVEMDIEVAGSIAPRARIAVYFAPNTEQGFIDAIYAAIFDTANQPAVLSISWGAPEDAGWTAAGLSGMDTAFATAAAFGVTVLAAAGDNGSNDRVYDGKAHCDFPASDPYVLACGGTTLQVNPDQTVDEIVWDNPGFGWATGGGISDRFPTPSWQAGKGVPVNVNDSVSTGRGVPDVAGDADPHTGYKVVIDGHWGVEGGTSAVAPLYAGLIALLNQSFGFPLGFITPFIYSLYETNAFVGISKGSNQIYPAPGYSAGAGWDACTGLGRIDGKNLLTGLQ